MQVTSSPEVIRLPENEQKIATVQRIEKMTKNFTDTDVRAEVRDQLHAPSRVAPQEVRRIGVALRANPAALAAAQARLKERRTA